MRNSLSRKHLSLDRWTPILLFFFAIWDLRLEVRLLADHFTLTSFLFTLRHHSLAVLVLISTPSIFFHYGLLERFSNRHRR